MNSISSLVWPSSWQGWGKLTLRTLRPGAFISSSFQKFRQCYHEFAGCQFHRAICLDESTKLICIMEIIESPNLHITLALIPQTSRRPNINALHSVSCHFFHFSEGILGLEHIRGCGFIRGGGLLRCGRWDVRLFAEVKWLLHGHHFLRWFSIVLSIILSALLNATLKRLLLSKWCFVHRAS